MLAASCKKGSNTTPPTPPVTPTTVAQDRANIMQSLDDLSLCGTGITQGDGAQRIIEFLRLNDLDILSSSWIEDMFDASQSVINVQSMWNNRKIDLSNNQGIYTYNHNSQTWSKTPAVGTIIINGPANSSSATNNATFTLTQYTDKAVVIDGETNFVPTIVKAKLEVNNDEIFNIDGTIAYNANGFPIPTSINIDVFLKPYSYKVTSSRINPNNFVGAVTISGTACDVKVTGEVDLLHSDYAQIIVDGDVAHSTKTLKTTIEVGDFKIDAFSDVQSLEAINSPTANDYNAFSDIDLFYQNIKVGELELRNVNGSDHLFVIYQDGSQEDVEALYVPVLQDLESKIGQYFGDFI